MNIKLPSILEVPAPSGTKVIANDDFITLARKNTKKDTFKLFTCRKEEIHLFDLNQEDNWMDFTRDELKKVLALK
jgi:hypothetical protein